MSIPIIDPFLPSEPPPDSDPPAAPPAAPLILDSTSTATGPPRLSIVGYSRAIGDPNVEFQTTEYLRVLYNANNRNELYAAYSIESLSLFELLSKLITAIRGYQAIYAQDQTQVASLNGSINTYNSSRYNQDVAAVAAINNAIAAYNGGGSLADYTTAANTYNAYVTARNASSDYTDYANGVASFNAFVSTSGTQIDAINSTLSTVNITALPKETAFSGSLNTLSTISTTVPPASVSGVSQPAAVTSTMTTTPGSLNIAINQYLITVFFSLTEQQQQTISILNAQSDLQGFLQFQLLGSVATLPESITTPVPTASTNTAASAASGAITGSGVAMSSIVASLSNPITTAILDQSVYNAYLASTNNAEPVQFLQLFNALNLLLLSRTGLAAGTSVGSLFTNSNVNLDLQSSLVSIGVGASVAAEIALAVENGVVGPAVYDLLQNAFPGVDANTLNALAEQLTTGAELVLLLLGLTQLGQALNDPTLYGRVIATLNAEEDLGVTAPAAPTTTAEEVLADNERAEALRSSLTSALAVQAGISQNQAAAIIDSAVNTVLLSQDDLSSGNLGRQIINSLVSNGISTSDAQTVGDLADSYVQSEISSGDILDQSLSDTTLSQGLLANSYVQTLLQNNEITTVRQLRDALAAEIATAEGNTPSQALLAANVAVTGQPAAVTATSVEELRTQLLNEVTTKLQDLGETNADQLAQQIVSTVIGNGDIETDRVSLARQINDRVQALVDTNDYNLTNAVKESLSTLLATTTDLWALGEWIRDPANAILQTIGIDRTSAEPSNYKRDIDTRI